jgi:predicted phage-related endonuclease
MTRYTRIRDFHATRATGVGSSDIPILAGMYRRHGSTTLSLWEQKCGITPPWDGNERTRVGHDLEAYVLYRFIEARYGEEIADTFYHAKLRDSSSGPFKAMTEARHPERPYCLAHADCVIEGDEGSVMLHKTASVGPTTSENVNAYEVLRYPCIVEAKVVGLMAGKRREGQIFTGYDIEDPSYQGIPDAVYLQVQWQLYCYDVQTAYVAALIDNQYHEWGPIEADARVQERCLALAERFWRLVETRTKPAPETWDDVQKLFPVQKNETATISGQEEFTAREMIARDAVLLAKWNEIKEEREDIKNAIGVLLGENSVLASGAGDILATSSEVERKEYTVKATKYRKLNY